MRHISLLSVFLFAAASCAVDASEPDPIGTPDTAPELGAPTPDSEPGDLHVPTPLELGLDTGSISGNVRLFLTDAPGDFEEVWVNVSEVRLALGTDDGSEWLALTEQPSVLDLLTLQDDVTAVMGDANLAPGYYGQMRFVVEDANVVVDGESETLNIPSGTQTGIKLNLDFEVEADKVYALVIDFDAAESIKRTGRGLQMQPVIKLEYVGVVQEDGSLLPLGGADTEQVPEESPEDSGPEETPEDSEPEEQDAPE